MPLGGGCGEIYLREMRTWECYGSGIDAAEMLMKDLYFEDITTKEAIPLLAYVVEAVSEICLDCGGPVSVITVGDQGLKELPQAEVERELERIKPLMDRFRKELPKSILKGETKDISEQSWTQARGRPSSKNHRHC